MTVTITLRGALKKKFPDFGEKVVELQKGTTCDEALASVGINYKEIPSFGFVSVNGKRVMIYEELHEGDLLKAYSRVTGG